MKLPHVLLINREMTFKLIYISPWANINMGQIYQTTFAQNHFSCISHRMKAVKGVAKMMKFGKQRPPPDEEDRISVASQKSADLMGKMSILLIGYFFNGVSTLWCNIRFSSQDNMKLILALYNDHMVTKCLLVDLKMCL